MSYEFNPESQIFEFPNPYKVENIAIIISGSFMILAGAFIMIGVRDRIAQGADGRALVVVGISICLLLFGIGLLARAFTQLRYFFGRNRPDSLAQIVATDQDGDSHIAGAYRETLRQNAITFHEPTGPLNGLLYSWLPHLIFAPRVIQVSAQTQFYNFLSLTATFVSFLLCWLMFGQSSANGWIGLVYGAFGFFQIMRPMVTNSAQTTGPIAESANVGMGGVIVLIVLAVLGPVILGLSASSLPNLDGLSINGVVLVAMLCALIGSGVFGLSLKNQLQPSPQAVGAARVTETLTMNAHPNKLIEELDRILMNRWYSSIPNRRYTRRSPNVSGQQGQFSAEIFEETQPRPLPNRIATGVGHALSMTQFFWLTCLTGLAMIYLAAGTIASIFAAQDVLHATPASTTIAFALSEFAVGIFCYRAAHVLWGRFDFVSELIWVDLTGSFESAKVQIGNQLSGSVQTTKNVINIETMTMRVWVSEIDTVIFGKDAKRQLIGMRGLQTVADELASSLKGFGEARSMVVAPTSSQDLERAQKIGIMSQLISGQAQQGSTDRLATALIASTQNHTEVAHDTSESTFLKRLFCNGCGVSMDADASFCGDCGKSVAG